MFKPSRRIIAVTPLDDPDEIPLHKRYTHESLKREDPRLSDDEIEEMLSSQPSNLTLKTPDQAKERHDQGIIRYIGDGCRLGLKEGEHVLFPGYGGDTLKIDGVFMILVPERLIIGKVHDDVTQISGLFFRDKEGNPIPATLEIVIDLIARTVQANNPVQYSQKREYTKFDQREPIGSLAETYDMEKEEEDES